MAAAFHGEPKDGFAVGAGAESGGFSLPHLALGKVPLSTQRIPKAQKLLVFPSSLRVVSGEAPEKHEDEKSPHEQAEEGGTDKDVENKEQGVTAEEGFVEVIGAVASSHELLQFVFPFRHGVHPFGLIFSDSIRGKLTFAERRPRKRTSEKEKTVTVWWFFPKGGLLY